MCMCKQEYAAQTKHAKKETASVQQALDAATVRPGTQCDITCHVCSLGSLLDSRTAEFVPTSVSMSSRLLLQTAAEVCLAGYAYNLWLQLLLKFVMQGMHITFGLHHVKRDTPQTVFVKLV